MKLLISFVLLSFAIPLFTTFEFSAGDVAFFLPLLSHSPVRKCDGPNEINKMCKSQCSDCTQRGRCITSKCEAGCDCLPRFFRVKPDGPCEPVGNCPKTDCGENEVFRDCGPICETCLFDLCQLISCDHKCYCKQGYRRSMNGTCIPQEACQPRKRCSRKEEWRENGPVDEFCLSTNGSNDTQDVSRCYCKKGFKRSLIGCCTEENLCPNITNACVLPNQIFHECVPKCNTTCRNYGSPDCTEDEICFSGCFCKPGYVMNDFQACILPQNCSLDIKQMKELESPKQDDEKNTTAVKSENITVTTELYSSTASSENGSEISSDWTVDDSMSSASPTKTTSVAEGDEKQKSDKSVTDASYSEAKSESVSQSKATSSQEVPDDDGDFDIDNSEI